MKTLADRIRRLSPGYQGMDDQASIAREVEEIESRLAWAEGMLERASNWMCGIRSETPIEESEFEQSSKWLADLEAGPGGERDE